MLDVVDDGQHAFAQGDAEVDDHVTERPAKDADGSRQELWCDEVSLFRFEGARKDHGSAGVIEHGAQEHLFEGFG